MATINNSVNNSVNKLDKLIQLLERTLSIFEEDRALAMKNYKAFEEQMESIFADDALMSEEGKIEQQRNKALELVLKSADRLETVLKTITNITIQELNNESRERIADKLQGSIPNKPISFKDVLYSSNEEKKEIE